MSAFRIALPRAINLGSHKKVAMADLRKLVADLGFDDPETILNSGNLIFRSDLAATKLEGVLERAAEKELGLSTDFYVRTPAQWNKLIADNPFEAFARKDPSHMMVFFCKTVPSKLELKGAKDEEAEAKGRDVYVTYPGGIGTSKLKMNIHGTGRNWNTILKIADLIS